MANPESLNLNNSANLGNAVIITLSDRCYEQQKDDISGPLLKSYLEEFGFYCQSVVLLPDDKDMLKETLMQYSHFKNNIDLIVTNGGTGISPRDITVDVTKSIVDFEIDGYGEWFRSLSKKYTPYWFLSRATAGVCNQKLILNFPGNPKSIHEIMPEMKNILVHMLKMIHGSHHD